MPKIIYGFLVVFGIRTMKEDLMETTEQMDKDVIKKRLVDIAEMGKRKGEFTLKTKKNPKKLARHFPGVTITTYSLGGSFIVKVEF